VPVAANPIDATAGIRVDFPLDPGDSTLQAEGRFSASEHGFKASDDEEMVVLGCHRFVLIVIIANVTQGSKNTANRSTSTTNGGAGATTSTSPPATAAIDTIPPVSTVPPTTATPHAVAPATTAPPATQPPTTAAVAPPATTGCYIDPEGNCYFAGEYCPDKLHGQTVQGGSGLIICENNNGWRWEPA
jgi:hypothetical protein